MKGGLVTLILGAAAMSACSGGSTDDSSGGTPGTTTNTVTVRPPTASSPPTPPTSTSASPEGFTVVSARNFGVACDGVMNDTSALQSALDALKSYQALQLPAGTCLLTDGPLLSSKSNVMVFGAGMDQTILQVTDPLKSAFVVYRSSNVTLRGLQVYSPNSTTRKAGADQNGFYVDASSHITIDGVKSRKPAGGGILLRGTVDSRITNSVVDRSLADAFHITGSSQRVVVQGNHSIAPGDDSFASIGYGTGINRDISFIENRSEDGWWGSCVSFEGTIGGKAYRNQCYRSGAAGIRIASAGSYSTGEVENIDLQDNYLEGVVTRRASEGLDHGAIMLYASYRHVRNISIARTKIVNPVAVKGFFAYGNGADKNVVGSLTDTTMADSTGHLRSPVVVGTYASFARSGNTLNGVAAN